MIRALTILASCLLAATMPASAGSLRKAKPSEKDYLFQDGDIVFQGNAGPQSDAVRAATDSPYTHCGVVFQHEGNWMVMEAVHPVQVTPLKSFMARSMPDTFHAMRPDPMPDADALQRARGWAQKQVGQPYDLKFQWTDEALYCSEFVWKLYQQAGVELCKTRPFRSYDLAEPVVKRIIDERYGGLQNFPLNEPAVAPGDLASSPLLVEVPTRARKKR